MKLLKHVSLALIVAFLGLNLAACGGGVSDTTIPAPPNSSTVAAGEDPTIDLMVSGIEQQLPTIGAEQGVTVKSPVTYKTTDDVASVESFYRKEMTDRGWTEDKVDAQETGIAVLAFESGDNGAIILAMDMTQFLGTGTVVFTMNGTKN